MLKKRIIPIVLLDGFSVLKTINFNIRRNVGSPITVLRTYNTRNVDELILLDIDASRNDRTIDRFIVQDIAAECFMPLTIGGGLKTLTDISSMLNAGADKITINTAAIENPELISDAAKSFGSQAIVVSIDVKKENGKYYVFKNGEIFQDIDLINWCKKAASLGAGELLINSVDLDGTLMGGDKYLADLISNSVNVPVIYAGGISSEVDCANVADSKVTALGIASLFHFTGITPNDCKNELARCHIPVRLK
ncbi:imidazole glycerol phosphate synthase cyclase subunit [Gammaproteobacteria bacterium]|jgi:imidazole glycerol-phosphate synthase subunit HisF|nr:imidazole glycerol phosphate synthase cyclase subunit [Gammaproteobacteria bacterium]